jgi:hypothetical protein
MAKSCSVRFETSAPFLPRTVTAVVTVEDRVWNASVLQETTLASTRIATVAGARWRRRLVVVMH